MREFPEERLIIERLWSMFQKDWLTVADIAQFDGCSTRTVRRRYNISKGGMSVCTLAHLKCELSRK